MIIIILIQISVPLLRIPQLFPQLRIMVKLLITEEKNEGIEGNIRKQQDKYLIIGSAFLDIEDIKKDNYKDFYYLSFYGSSSILYSINLFR